MSTKVVVAGVDGAEAGAVLAALQRRSDVEVVYLGAGGASPLGGHASEPPPASDEGWSRVLSGASLLIDGGRGAGDGLGGPEAAIRARTPMLVLTHSPARARALLGLSDLARRSGVPAVVAGGLLPGVGAQLASLLLADAPEGAQLTVTYARAGWSGAAAPCLRGLSTTPSELWSAGRWVAGAPASDPTAVELTLPFGPARSLRIGNEDLLGLTERHSLSQAQARLVLAPTPASWGLWLAARMSGGRVCGGQSGQLSKLASSVAGRLGPQGVEHVRVIASVRGAHTTRSATVRSDVPAAALSAAVSCLLEPLLSWQVPLGVHTSEAACSPQRWAELWTQAGMDAALVRSEQHTLTPREVRRLHILAP